MTDAQNLNTLTGGTANYAQSLKEKAALGRRPDVQTVLAEINQKVEKAASNGENRTNVQVDLGFDMADVCQQNKMSGVENDVHRALASAGFIDFEIHIAPVNHGECWFLIKNLQWDSVGTGGSIDANATGLEGKCPICYDENVSMMALTPCGHTICTGCIGNFVGKECPTCRQNVSGVQGVFPN